MSESKAEARSFEPDKSIQFPHGSTLGPDSPAQLRLPVLAQLAKRAFESKRKKHSLALARSILRINPKHKLALVIESWVRTELARDLDDVRELVERAIAQNDRVLYAKAETALKAILDVNPGSEEAGDLLEDIASRQRDDQLRLPFPPSPSPRIFHSYRGRGTKKRVVAVLIIALFGVGVWGALIYGEMRFTTKNAVIEHFAPSGVAGNAEPATKAWLLPIVLPAPNAQMTLDEGLPGPVPVEIEIKPGDHHVTFAAIGFASETLSTTVAAGERRALTVLLKPLVNTDAASPVLTPEVKPSQPPTVTANAASVDKPSQAKATGILAVSAAIPVDIYNGDKYLGSTPVSLTLPAGSQTLEYRYGGLRKTLSYTIESNQTTATAVIFDLVVQINAKPWAQVFIDGDQATPLGQTPISNVKVPVGSTLVFRNPAFADKKYRVTGVETALQVVFP